VLFRFGDEGTLVYGAVRVLEGQVPSKDFFEVIGPGTFYWLALFFKVFGTNWYATRAAVLVGTSGSYFLLYLFSRRLGVLPGFLPAILLLSASFPLWLMPSHHSLGNLLVLISFWVLLMWLDQRRRILLAAAGLLVGLATCVMQPKGCLLFLSYLLIAYIFERDKLARLSSICYLLTGYISVGILVALLFWKAGALGDLYYANIVWPLTRYENVNSVPYGFGFTDYYWHSWITALRSVFPATLAFFVTGCFAIPLLTVLGLPLLLVLFALRLRAVAFSYDDLPFWICGTALWVSEFHRKDTTHLLYGSPLLLVLAFYLHGRLRDNFNVGISKLMVFCSLTLAACNLLIAQAAQVKTITRRGTVYQSTRDAALEFLQTQVKPGEEVFVYPYYPMYYFLADVKNPTPFSILMYNINTQAQFQDAIRALERRRVKYVLSDTEVTSTRVKIWFPSYKEPAPDDLVMERYLEQNYRVLKIENGFRIMERNAQESTGKLSPVSDGSKGVVKHGF